MPKPTPAPKNNVLPSSERPLVEDIRLLGRILGDVIREQEGDEAYALIEQIRQLSVSFRRHADPVADKALNKLLKSLSGDQTVSVVRAFTYFSHLANLAEDRHHIRRRAVHERAGSIRPGSIDMTHKRLSSGGITRRDLVAQVHADEAVIPLDALPQILEQRSSRSTRDRDARSGGGGDLVISVPVMLDGEMLGRAVARISEEQLRGRFGSRAVGLSGIGG